jgi:hypothetical protein
LSLPHIGTSIELKPGEARWIKEFIGERGPYQDEENVGKMDIPLRRIVGFIAMGLRTGVLLRLIHQTLQKIKGKTDALRGGALETFEVEGERFRTRPSSPPRIAGSCSTFQNDGRR